MAIEVNDGGLLSTIQDMGRHGLQKYGVVVSGAQDKFSMQIANILVGNDEAEGTIEICMHGSSYYFQEDHLIAITGANLQPSLNGKKIAMWRPIYVPKGSTLTFYHHIQGFYAYLAIAGGFHIEEVFHSKSTYVRGGLGGYKGRELRKGDKLTIQEKNEWQSKVFKQLKSQHQTPSWFVPYNYILPFTNRIEVEVLHGSHNNYFTETSLQRFETESYVLTPRVDRMGYSFVGEELQRNNKEEILSEAVSFGTIQIPPNGQPLLLTADSQTTGGYPKIAHVITADLPKVVQMSPGQEITFKFVTLERAEQKYNELYEFIQKIKRAINVKLAL